MTSKIKIILSVLTLSYISLYTEAQTVFISQYIETNSGTTPKGIEIFNPTNNDIVFSSSNNLQVLQGTNGGTCSGIVNITSGTLKPGEVWVIGTSDLTTYANSNGTDLSGTTVYAFAFNGDDALQLKLGSVTIDMIGTCGSDPGSAWTGGGVSTADNNIQTKNGICEGTTSSWTNPSLRFETVAIGTVMTGFGNAPTGCSSSTPTITISTTSLSVFTYNLGAGPSNYQNFTVSGSNLTGDISLSAPTNYEISQSSGSGYGSSISLTPSGGTVASVTIYVRLKAGLSAGNYNGETINITSSGATSKTVSCSGTVTTPTITVSTTGLTGFSYNLGAGPSSSQNFTVSGSSLTANISLSAPTNYEISTSSGSGYGPSLNLTQTGGSVSNTTIYVRLKAGLSIANYNDELISITSSGATSKTVECDGTVVCGTPAAPVATDASSIDEDSFTANWNAVSGASGYYLDIQEGGGFITETFTSIGGGTTSSYLTRSWTGDGGIGWTAYKSRTDQVVFSGNDAVCLQNATDAYIISEEITGDINLLEFDVIQAFTGSGGILTVKILHGSGFLNETLVGTISYTTTQSTFSEVVNGITGNYKIRIDNNTAARPVIDNLKFGAAPTFFLENEDVGNVTSYVVNGLTTGTTYYYRVRAYNACSGVSSNSNVISVVPVEPPDYSNIFISELSGLGYNGNFNNEYIEFSNIGSTPINITGFKIKYYAGASLEGSKTLSGTIAANDAYVVAIRTTHTGLSPDAVFSPSLSINESYYVILEDADGNIIDQAGSSSDLFSKDINYEFTNCGGNNLPVANWISLGSGNGNPGTVTCVSTSATDGDGSAIAINNTGAALQGFDIWQRNQSAQKMRIVVTGDFADYLAGASIELPVAITDLSAGNISLSGDAKVGGTGFTLSGNTISISGAEISNTKTLIVDINGFTSPVISDITDDGIDTVVVKTCIQGGTLTAIANHPVIYTTIPITNVKHYNSSTGDLFKLDKVVAVEGISTIASGRLATDAYDQFFIQEGEGSSASGLCVRKTGSFSPAAEISIHYVIKGGIKLVRANSDTKTDARANMTAISNPTEIISLGEAVLPLPYITTIDQLYGMTDTEFEAVDGVLMRIMNASKSSGTWPSSNSNFANIYIKDNAGTNTLRCYIFANTNIGGNDEPAWPVNMLTLVYNYDDDNDDVGDGPSDRQITPVYYDNFYTKLVWRGSTGNKLWSDTRNWSPYILPQTVDSVIFDNITGPADDYEVIIDNLVVPYVSGIHVNPSAGKNITVIIPNTNTNSPAIDLAANGSGLVIGEGSIFINNSGTTSGDPIMFHSSGGIYPPFKIENGGRYIHKTLRSSASMTERLSADAGTEDGTFEYDLPSASANFQISASGKTFGNLEFSATYGAKNYAISGPSAITIRGDLIVNNNVNINELWSSEPESELKFKNEIIVGGDFIFSGSGWNINTENPANQIRFNGNAVQTIADNSGALSSAGGFGKNIIINNPSGVSLGSNLTLNNTLSLLSGNIILGNYKLTINNTLSYGAGLIEGSSNSSLRLSGTQPVLMNFKVPAMLGTLELDKTGMNIPLTTNLSISDSLKFNGGIISTGTNAILFGDNAGCSGAGTTSFINGNVSKSGSQTFAFPTGNVTTRDIGNGLQTYSVFAPISLTPVNGSSTSTVAYLFTEPPYDWWPHGENMDETMVWVSSREYWNVSTTGDISTVILVWSENDHNEGETCIHDICPNGIPAQFNTANLTVTAFYNNRWRDLGVATASGNHEAGSITSLMGLPTGSKAGNYIVSFGSLNKDVTLPVEWLSLQAENIFEDIELEWRTASETNNSGFVVEHAGSDFQFSSIGFIKGSGNSSDVNAYQFLHNKPGNGVHYYRLKQLDFDGNYQYSGIVSAQLKSYSENLMTDFYINSNGIMYISGKTSTNNPMDISVFDTYGRMIEKHNIQANNFRFETSVNVGSYKAGMYYYSITDGMNILTEKFVITE
ncbi:MAG TPA: lamin tail domain-containing protein [Bacteroidales bacterium]|nr:lamin tail domain-containing protein [Bacteroidales bacterium]